MEDAVVIEHGPVRLTLYKERTADGVVWGVQHETEGLMKGRQDDFPANSLDIRTSEQGWSVWAHVKKKARGGGVGITFVDQPE